MNVKFYKGELEFSVQDTGVGISEEDLERIFEPFERAYTASGHKTEGTGLGLSISKILAERMGGDRFR